MAGIEKNIKDKETIEIETPDLTPDPEGGEIDLVMEDPATYLRRDSLENQSSQEPLNLGHASNLST